MNKLSKPFISTLIMLSIMKVVPAQNKNTIVPDYLNFEVTDSLKQNIFNSLDFMFKDMKLKGMSNFIDKRNEEITYNLINSVSSIEYYNPNVTKQIINAYEIGKNEYLLKIAYIDCNENSRIHAIISIMAKLYDELVTFSSPISHLTSNWTSKQQGTITYYYNSFFNDEVAKNFNKNNSNISSKLGVPVEKLNFYKCYSYQEALTLIGIDFLLKSNGKVQLSKIIGNTIITGLNSEDFSHDIFHFYSAKLFERKNRNWIAEEGIAYSWGNAYYTDSNGKMIERDQLISLLKIYLKENPQESLLELFQNKTKIFNEVSPYVSVRSTISSLICDEVQRKKDIEGLKVLINSGKGEANFFNAIDNLLGINKNNFDKELEKLLELH